MCNLQPKPFNVINNVFNNENAVLEALSGFKLKTGEISANRAVFCGFSTGITVETVE